MDLNGPQLFRERIIFSILSGKSIKIKNIGKTNAIENTHGGIFDYQEDFLKLIEKLIDGAYIKVKSSGTLIFKPGLFIGGEIEHACCTSRSISYYLEAILLMAPFCGKPLTLILTGVTNNKIDKSVDILKDSIKTVMPLFMRSTEGLSIEVINRGMAPLGGGKVIVKCPNIKTLRPIMHINQGKVKKIHGVAFTTRVSPAFGFRMVTAAKDMLSKLLPNVYITLDHKKGKSSGKCPGFGIVLWAETTTDCSFSAEAVSNLIGSTSLPSVPEDLGTEAAEDLIRQIYHGGCVDSNNQQLSLLYMALGPPDVSKLLCGEITLDTERFLEHVDDFFQVRFKREQKAAETKSGGDKVMMTCIGIGFSNLARETK